MSTSVLYITSRYPKVTETFVVNEWLTLRSRFEMHLAALHRSREPIVQPDAARVLPDVWFVRVAGRANLADHCWWLRHRPRAYLSALAALVRDCATRPRLLAKSLYAFAAAGSLARRAKAGGVSHVHACFANHPATAAWVVHRLTELPFTFTAHANDVFLRPAAYAHKLADARFVVTVSEYNAARIRGHASASECDVGSDVRVHVVHCGVDTGRFVPSAPTADRPRDRHRVLCVASLEPKKGHRYLLEAVAALGREGAPVHLVLVGDGPERAALEQRTRDLAIADRVEFLGARTSSEVHTELQRAGVFVLASIADPSGRMEGIPVALMEAMASGVPVITTRLSGIPELVEDAGLLVDPMDASALARALARLITDGDLARTLIARGRERVVAEFDLVTQGMRVADLFEYAPSR